MTKLEAKKQGIEAFENGKCRAPALNNKFLVAACGSKTETNYLLNDYLYGYDIASLSKDSIDSNLPSVIEYNSIMGE